MRATRRAIRACAPWLAARARRLLSAIDKTASRSGPHPSRAPCCTTRTRAFLSTRQQDIDSLVCQSVSDTAPPRAHGRIVRFGVGSTRQDGCGRSISKDRQRALLEESVSCDARASVAHERMLSHAHAFMTHCARPTTCGCLTGNFRTYFFFFVCFVTPLQNRYLQFEGLSLSLCIHSPQPHHVSMTTGAQCKNNI